MKQVKKDKHQKIQKVNERENVIEDEQQKK
jgi:hypothetical protein